MVDTPYNRRLVQFHDREASSLPEQRATKMENKIIQAVRGTSERSVFHVPRGWKSSNCSPLPVEGEVFSLTFPFIDQAMSLRTLSMSDMGFYRQSPFAAPRSPQRLSSG